MSCRSKEGLFYKTSSYKLLLRQINLVEVCRTCMTSNAVQHKVDSVYLKTVKGRRSC